MRVSVRVTLGCLSRSIFAASWHVILAVLEEVATYVVFLTLGTPAPPILLKIKTS